MENETTPFAVRECALAAHQTIYAFLEQAGVQYSSFYRWEKGQSKPSALTMRKLSDAVAARTKGASHG